ncbi:MAG: DEAD/DEAH box helicase family protein [Bacteroidaceae bacterium]|nr:DEAD/DEAH box helicase family protein [Bacteroidaceae bacterium]
MAKKNTKRPARLQEALVLHKYILHLLGCRDLAALSEGLKDPALEGVDDEGTSRIFYALKMHMYDYEIKEEKLYEYDRNIVKHTREINERRDEKITWKYYQYLALLFTEIYLDRFFSDKQRLLDDINEFMVHDFNQRTETWHDMPMFTEDDLNKVAFWAATGSGKTLMMHVNIKQYLHYAEKHNAKKLNRIMILTPNEGLSKQHIEELKKSNFDAQFFSKQGRGGFFEGQAIDVIDINKLAEQDGDKTVAVDSFEGNNLVLVDEGHKGSGGEVWKGYRNKLTQEGFSFEYSATFGQAIAAQTGANRTALLEEYGKATLFDYSYRYFYNDGYGKDYRIMNMETVDNEELLNMYLTAYLLCLYEQTLAFDSDTNIKNKFLIARPLGIFVGSSVNAVRSEGGRKVSDVVKILLFFQDFINRPSEFSGYIKRLLNPNDGIKNPRGYSLFANNFLLTKQGLKLGEEDAFAAQTYHKMIERLFHSNVPNAHLHIDKQKGGDGEIGLRVGNAPYFGVINVGDSDTLIKLCESNDLDCETREFGNNSLFSHINDDDSTINILIGSKKFSEGWSSWRVSAMGLMNVGRSEGSEIIQLFGRGVRLKGYKYSLKRSTDLDSSYNPGNLPKGLREIETLNIFGVRADYMDTFRKYLEDEGLPNNEEKYTEVKIPTVNLLGKTKLKIVRLKEGYDFKKTVVVHPEDCIDKVRVKVDWLPKVDALWSKKAGVDEGAVMPKDKLRSNHLALINWNKIFFAIEQMKNERSWWNMELSTEVLQRLMKEPDWYELFIQEDDLKPTDYGRDVSRWEDITIALLRAYIDRAYKMSKGKWESKYMETVYLSPNDPNFFEEYTVEVRNDQQEWIEKLHELREQILSGNLERDFSIYGTWITSLRFDQHLFYPLLCLQDKDANGKKLLEDKDNSEPLIKISPVALNPGEKRFVADVRRFFEDNKVGMLAGKEIYLLRNESRKGIGFFEASGFYPDFILWVNDGQKQHVTFIDPKGIRNLKGLQDPKIQLYKMLKEEVEPTLQDADITLDSYILSNTPYQDVNFWGTRPEFAENHVLFDDEEKYIDILFKKILETK